MALDDLDLGHIDFPTLAVAAYWVEQHCIVPDGLRRGERFGLVSWQADAILNFYRLKPSAQRGQLAPAFHYRRLQIVLPQKALAVDTPIVTPSGWSTMGDLQPGDVVFDASGAQTRVVSKSQVWESDTYRVSFSDRSSLVACGDHEWVVDRRTSSGTYVRERASTSRMAERLVDSGGARIWRVPVAGALQLPDVELPLHPYVLGAWLGDGETNGQRITGIDRQVFDEIAGCGFEVRQHNHKTWGVIGLRAALRAAGVLTHKRVPAEYLRASVQQRWSLLQGLMDTDGYCDGRQGKCEFTTTSPDLRDGTCELLTSLGIKYRCYEARATLYGRDMGPKWRIAFGARSDMPVFRLARKQARLRPPGGGHAQFEHRRVVAIERVDTVPTQCLTVESESSTFLAGRDMIPTGNSGKAPYTAAHVCVEAVGPALFAGWARGGETWDCRDHGCGCGWVYEYQSGEAMGMCWPTPLIQITATSGDQTDNVYAALRPMIDRGPLAEVIPRTGEEFIRLPDDGRIDAVTSNATSRLGQRVTFCPQDETGVWVSSNGMIKVAETQRRGLAGMGGRAEETTNAWDPNAGSVAQRTAEAAERGKDIFRIHPLPPRGLSYKNKEERRKIHRHVYAGCAWVDLDSIEGEAAELVAVDAAQAERFFGNRPVAGSGVAFDADAFDALKAPRSVEAGAVVTLGIDGARHDDALAVIACDVTSGYLWVVDIIERPDDADEHYKHDQARIDAAVREVFLGFSVWRAYCDPQHIPDLLAGWQNEFGEKRVIEWQTYRPRPIAWAVRNFTEAIGRGDFAHDGNEILSRHVANSYRRALNVLDDKERPMHTLAKDAQHSPRKIDAAMAAVLAWEARSDAVAAGAVWLGEEPEVPAEPKRASWRPGFAPPMGQVGVGVSSGGPMGDMS